MCPGVSGMHKQVSSDISCLQTFLQSWMVMLATEIMCHIMQQSELHSLMSLLAVCGTEPLGVADLPEKPG